MTQSQNVTPELCVVSASWGVQNQEWGLNPGLLHYLPHCQDPWQRLSRGVQCGLLLLSAGPSLLRRDAPPLLPSDTTQGYRTVKAKLGSKKVRPWKWMPFTNPARKDGAMFYHWRRAAEEGKDYPFARFNKVSGSMWGWGKWTGWLSLRSRELPSAQCLR